MKNMVCKIKKHSDTYIIIIVAGVASASTIIIRVTFIILGSKLTNLNDFKPFTVIVKKREHIKIKRKYEEWKKAKEKDMTDVLSKSLTWWNLLERFGGFTSHGILRSSNERGTNGVPHDWATVGL